MTGTPHEVKHSLDLFFLDYGLLRWRDLKRRGNKEQTTGITEETTVMGVPCLTLRDNTERPETVTVGTNELIGTDPAKLGPALARLMAGKGQKGSVPEKWDGRVAERIVTELERLLA